MPLDVAAATKTMREKVAAPLGLDVLAAADGILRIATTKMSYAVKAVTTARGLDAGDFALVAYGGAGPLHATAIAREIGIRRVIIPRAPGHFSAFGMLFSDLRYDFVRTWFVDLRSASFETLDEHFRRAGAAGPGSDSQRRRPAESRSGPAIDGYALCRPRTCRHSRYTD